MHEKVFNAKKGVYFSDFYVCLRNNLQVVSAETRNKYLFIYWLNGKTSCAKSFFTNTNFIQKSLVQTVKRLVS